MVWFKDADLRRLAGGQSYERGLGYLDAVSTIGELPDGVVATVHGTGNYRVRLSGLDDGVLDGECSCPYGRDGAFCKHCVALGLRLLAEAAASPAAQAELAPRSGKRAKSKKVDLKQFLTTMDHVELVELVWRHASEDAALFQRLSLLAATAAGVPDLSALRSQVEWLQVDWIGYGDERTYAEGAGAVVEALDRLVPKQAAAAQPLLRKAVTYIGRAAGSCEDDSGTVIDCADAAWQAYLRACEAAPPDPVELGRWYVDFQLTGPEWPETSLEDVESLLGQTGLAAYGQRLDEVGHTQARDWRLRSMREEYVAATGDTDDFVACLAEDLSGPHQYVRIAEVLRGAGRVADAVGWLEQGFDTTGGFDYRVTTLVDLLAELYPGVGRATEVVPLREKYFTSVGSSEAYQALRVAAESTSQWPNIRDRAITLLQKNAEANKGYGAAETLVAVLLDEDQVTQAWQAIGKHPCAAQTQVAVADRRAETHPGDAIAVYRPLVNAAVARTNNSGYEEATRLLLKMRPLYSRTGDNFAMELFRLKETNRRKRNFLAELARNGL